MAPTLKKEMNGLFLSVHVYAANAGENVQQ